MPRQPIQIIEERRKVLQELSETLLQELRLVDPYSPKRHIPRRAKARHPRKHSRQGAVMDTGLTKAVRATFPNLPETFTVHDMIKLMVTDGYRFENSNPISGVSGVLRKLTKKGEIALLRKGLAGKPSIYKRID